MYSVVVSVGYDVLTNLVDGDSSQTVKLAFAIAVATKSKDNFELILFGGLETLYVAQSSI